MVTDSNPFLSGKNGPKDTSLKKLYAIERHLRDIKCCLLKTDSEDCKKCDCSTFDLTALLEALANLDLTVSLGDLEALADLISTAIAETLAELDINVDIGNVCDKEYLCTPDCITVKCRECYDPNTGDVTSTTFTTLDGAVFTGDLATLTPNCANCKEDPCIILPGNSPACPPKVDDGCIVASGNKC